MQRLRLLVLGIVGFLGVFFAHGSWLNRLLAFTLCGVLSADSGLCMAQIAKFSGQANATTPDLIAEVPPYGQNVNPNFIRDEFSNPNSLQNSPDVLRPEVGGNYGPPRVCLHSGEYAVFVQHALSRDTARAGSALDSIIEALPVVPATIGMATQAALSGVLDENDIQVVHEHIFFCNDQQIVDNIGFGNSNNGSRFTYSASEIAVGIAADRSRIDDFVPIDNEQYDSDIIREIIGDTGNSCRLQPDPSYNGINQLEGINCQRWTAQVREEYWRRIKPTIEAFYCEGQKDADPCIRGWNQGGNLVIEYKARRKHSIDWQISGYTGVPTLEGTVEVTKRPDTIIARGSCDCTGSSNCDRTADFTATAIISDKRSSSATATASLKVRCQPGAGQVIQRVIDQVIPGGLPFRLPQF